MLTIRAAQMAVLARVAEPGVESRALAHLRNCIPEACSVLSEQELREIVRWGRKRSSRYGIEREYDLFRYLNLMFLFGFEFDSDPGYPWAARTLSQAGLAPSAKLDLLVDYAILSCSKDRKEQSV